MDREEIFSILLECINEFGGSDYAAEEIDRSRSPVDYGVDSLNVLQILTEIESRLGFEVDLSQLSEADFASINAVLDYLAAARLQGQRP
jgi:acyl carrier protein